MAASRAANPESDRLPHSDGLAYWSVSRRPLQILIFLLPLVLYYEWALATLLRSSSDGMAARTFSNHAHLVLVKVFDTLGLQSSGWYLPGAALIVVLLVWHVIMRQRWLVDVKALVLMAGEAALLTAPLWVAGGFLARLAADGASAPPAWTLLSSEDSIGQMSIPARVAFSVGAGIYEELVFRMLALAVLHTIFVDFGKMKERTGLSLAVLVSAILFMAYHWIGIGPGDVPVAISVFYLLSGVYFGAIYLVRGFGIVVAVHALYDVMASLTIHS